MLDGRPGVAEFSRRELGGKRSRPAWALATTMERSTISKPAKPSSNPSAPHLRLFDIALEP